MGQVLSSEEERSQVSDALGAILFGAMLEGGAVPDLGVVHPVLLANQQEGFDPEDRLQKQLRELQGSISDRAPAYLKDLVGRLTSFSEEPRLAGLVGLVVTMVMDMAYTSSRRSTGGKGKSAESSTRQQRVRELQEVMEEYLKRCRIHLGHSNRLIQDAVRLEGQLSLTLTQLKTCLLGGDCDSRSLRHWASGAAFHTQMLAHLAGLECEVEPRAARAALEQYKDDLTRIIPAYRKYKTNTVCVVKCRGGLPASRDPTGEVLEEGSMTGLTVTDLETGKSVTLPLSTLETETERRSQMSGSSSFNLDLITSDQYAQAYLEHLFSDQGPVAELQSYFNQAGDRLQTLRTQPGCRDETGGGDEEQREDGARGGARDETETRGEELKELDQRDESLKVSITETQPEESIAHGAPRT